MLPSPGAEAVAEPEERFLINLVQDGHDGALDDFIFQGAHPEGTLAAVRLRDVPPADGLCPIRPTMYTTMQVLKPWLHVLPIFCPMSPRPRLGRHLASARSMPPASSPR